METENVWREKLQKLSSVAIEENGNYPREEINFQIQIM